MNNFSSMISVTIHQRLFHKQCPSSCLVKKTILVPSPPNRPLGAGQPTTYGSTVYVKIVRTVRPSSVYRTL